MTAAESRRRDWEGRWRDYRYEVENDDCCDVPRGAEHKAGCVYGLGLVPRRGLVLEGDRVDSEQDSLDSFGRPWLPSSDDPGETRRDLPLLAPDWDETTAGRRP